MDITLQELRREHPTRERNIGLWDDYKLLYRGGNEFKRAAGTESRSLVRPVSVWDQVNLGFSGQRNRRFLYQWEGEPDPVYETLWQRSEYINYVAAIVDYFCQWLFTQPPQIRPTEGADVPAWFGPFTERCTGSRRAFIDFVKDVFASVLQCQRAGWLIGRDDSVGAVSAEDDQVILTPYEASEIYDWQHDCTGELEWIVLCKKQQYRDFPDQRREQETFTFIDRDMWQSWDVVKDGKTEILETEGPVTHGLGQVPFVELSVPSGMWILDKVAQPCIGIYNRWNRLKNAEALACVVQPYLVSADGDTSRVIGEGPIMKLRPAMKDGGTAEDFGWKTPNVGPLEFISAQLEKARDEVYRVVHQMSLAVDSKAVGAIARSGASKIEDRRSSQILLTAYGSYVAPAMIKTVELLSLIYGDNTQWSLDGFKNFDISSLDEELTTAAMAQSLGFKSVTARKRIELKAVGRVLDGEDESTMETIEEETNAAYDMEDMGAMAGMAGVMGDMGQESDMGTVSAIGQVAAEGDGSIDIDEDDTDDEDV